MSDVSWITAIHEDAHAVAAIRAGLVFDTVSAMPDEAHELDGALYWTEIQDSGELAMRLLGEQIRVDVLLTELQLPDMDGRDLAWAVCQKRPFARVAFMSARVPDDPVDPQGAPFLRKPFTATALSSALALARPLLRRSPR